MTLEQLRLKHPRLVYKNFTITQDETGITIVHEFLLEPEIIFRPKVTIPFTGKVDETTLAPYAFNLGLVEAISYWKAACPKEFVVEAGMLTNEQTRFWYDLFIHGLGEFFYKNEIDFTKPEFLTIKSRGAAPSFAEAPAGRGGDLVLVGGGKDSSVTLGIMATSDRTIQTMVLNPTKAALDTIRVAGFAEPIVVERTIDPMLLTLNNQGYLNGHTPFSAYLAFLGMTIAALYGNENVIVSNERSANEGNVMYKGVEVNHQYSKSFRFEELFRTYGAATFEHPANYFSILRPLNDVQIGMLFSEHPEFFPTFRSCNVGSKTGVWCGACPKCAFTYLTLSPFLSYEHMQQIFGRDYFLDATIISSIRELVGLTPVKPFECVGTRDEAKLAVYLAVSKYSQSRREVPEGLLTIKSDLNLTDADLARLHGTVRDTWGDTYNLPPEHLSLLRSAWERVRGHV